MNIYRYTITRRDNTEEPKIVYLLADNPIDGKILICIDAGISASDFHLYRVDVAKVEAHTQDENHHPAPERDEYVDAVNSLIAYFNRNSPGNIQYDKLQSYIRCIEACSPGTE